SRIHTVQPSTIAIKNIFNVSGNERTFRVYEHRGGCSGCGLRTTVALTDSRLIVREKDKGCCCCGGLTVDTTAFLQDIDLLQTRRRPLSIGHIINSVITCTIPCLLCDYFCGPKLVEIRGAFGSHVIAFRTDEVAAAAVQITSSIRHAKSKITVQPSVIEQR
ncbi:unnamed protein product, partial [Rotaria sp. Silwood2]